MKVFRASLMGNLPGKLPPPGYERIIAKGNYARCLVLSCRLRKGLQRKAHRKRIGASEDLQRKARFLAALAARNAPEDSRFPIRNLL
jgi:hypothetical protein